MEVDTAILPHCVCVEYIPGLLVEVHAPAAEYRHPSFVGYYNCKKYLQKQLKYR